MELFGSVSLLSVTLLLLGQARAYPCRWQFEGVPTKKAGSLLLAGAAVILGSMLGACGKSSPSIGLLAISPADGTVFVGAPSTSQAARHTLSSRELRAASVIAQPQDFASATCGNLQYSAMATYSDGTSRDVSTLVDWTSSNTSVATINNTGNTTAVAMGVTYIAADFKGIGTGQVPLYVDELNSLAIAPTTPNLPIGSATVPNTMQFSAMGTFTQPNATTNSRDITSLVTWSSTNPAIATISPMGVASTVSQGTTTIVATVCGISNTTMLTVGPPAPQSLQITPATPTIAVGAAVPFSALELWSDGTIHPLTSTLQWTSSAKNTVIANLTGVAFGFGTGTSTITAAEASGLKGTTTVTVQAAQAQFAYAANQQGNGTGSISSFIANTAGATLTPLASTPAKSPQQVLLGPSGNFLYAIDSASLVHVYQITTPSAATANTPAGTLTLLDSTIPPVPAGSGTGKNIGVIDPSGQFLYVIDTASNALNGFQIQQSQAAATPFGSLQPITSLSSSVFLLDSPTWIMTDRTGQFLYVLNAGNNTISGFLINFDGSLTPIGSSSPLPQTGHGPVYGSTDNQGHMYVANSGDNSVTAYLINGDGTWSPIGTLPVAGATSIINALTDPKAQYVYVLDQGSASGGQVFAYSLVLPTAGTIFGTQIGQAQPVGASPNGIAVDPSGALLAIDNKGSNNISLFTIAAGSSTMPGALAPATPSTAPTDAGPQFVVFYNGLPTPPPVP